MTQFTDQCYEVLFDRLDYRLGWEIQRRLAEARAADHIPDVLLILEHPHTYTLGRSADRANLLYDEAQLEAHDITVVDVDRGGDITYHGPGQLVMYPIFYLGSPDPTGRLVKTDYVGYLRNLEEVLIRTLAYFDITARRFEGYTGVWIDTATGPEKIAAIGVRVSARGVSTHGAALNITTDLSYFDGIIPCGIDQYPVTSMRKLLESACPDMENVMLQIESGFVDVFGKKIEPARIDRLIDIADLKS